MQRDIADNVFEEVKSEYEATLKIPAEKPEKQFFLCPVGLIGSGKTTVMKPLSEKLSLLRIEGDGIRKILHDRGFSYDSTWDIGKDLVQKYAETGYSIGYDIDGSAPKTIETLTQYSDKLGIKLIWIHINTPEEVIIERIKNEKLNWLFKTTEQKLENYTARKELHRNLPMQFTYTFDTSKENLSEEIEEAVKIIREETQGE